MSKMTTKRQNETILIDTPHVPSATTQSRMKRRTLPARRSTVAHHECPGLFADQKPPVPKGKFSVVSMFSGCGGMDFGFHGGFTVFGREYNRLPFEVIRANEHNEAACRTYRKNFGVEIKCEDVWSAVNSIPEQTDVLIGGFPCQDVSVNGKRVGVNGKRTGLYKAMFEGIGRTRQRIFIAENVKGLLMSIIRERHIRSSRVVSPLRRGVS